MSSQRPKYHQATSTSMNQLKQAVFRFYRSWRASKPKPSTTSTCRFSLKRLNDRIIYHYNTALSEVSHLCQKFRSDHQPAPSPKSRPVSLAAVMPFPHTGESLRLAPKLSLDEKVLFLRLEKAQREARLAKHDARSLQGMRCTTCKQRSFQQGPKLSIEQPLPSLRVPQSSLDTPASRTLSCLSGLAEEARKQTRELEERQLIRREEERRLAIVRAYEDRYKLIPPKPLRPVTEEPQLDWQREAERRKKNWLAKMPRTKEGELIAYGCGKKRTVDTTTVYDWEKEWEKKRTPPVCGKRKRVYSITASLEERKRQRRRIR